MEVFWTIAWIVAVGLVLLFAMVILVGAPFLPTLRAQVDPAFELLELKRGQTMLELGSGDGRMLVAAAQRGIKSVGYEINPLLFVYSWLITRKHRKYVRVIWGDYWQKQWPKADGIFVFLLNPYMKKLDTKIVQYMLDLRKYSDMDLTFSTDDRAVLSNRGEPDGSSKAETLPYRRTGGKDNTGNLGESSTHKPVKLVSFAFKIPNRKPSKTKDGMFLYEYS